MNTATQKLLDTIAEDDGSIQGVNRRRRAVDAWLEAGGPDATPLAKLELAREIVRVTKAADVFATVLLQQLQEAPPEALLALDIAITSRKDELAELIAAAYAEGYTEVALEAAFEFFQSPAGQEYSELVPSVAALMAKATASWGADLIADVMS